MYFMHTFNSEDKNLIFIGNVFVFVELEKVANNGTEHKSFSWSLVV